MINDIKRIFRRNWRRLGLKLGFIKPFVYEMDANLTDIINRVVNTSERDGAFIIAVETRQAAIKIMNYMFKNKIEAIAVSGMIRDDRDIPNWYLQSRLSNVVMTMRSSPSAFRVVVVNKNVAATGWYVPDEFRKYWGSVHMLTTFTPRNADWIEQFNGRVKRAA